MSAVQFVVRKIQKSGANLSSKERERLARRFQRDMREHGKETAKLMLRMALSQN
jgi:acyl-CoA reductase-like NAD-dependent aldehyde dehydrogenase